MNIKIQLLASFLILISCNKEDLIVPKLNNKGSGVTFTFANDVIDGEYIQPYGFGRLCQRNPL